MINEEWRDVVGYEGLYQVSNLGRVRSLDRIVSRRSGVGRGSAKKQPVQGRLLTNSANSSGYSNVTLSSGGRSKTSQVHVLVLKAFVGPRPDGYYCCHSNGDKSDNRVSNLRYDTPRGNCLDRITHGTCLRGEKNHKSKLTTADVLHIRSLSETGVFHWKIAERFGVAKSTVSNILQKRTWCHL